MTQRFALGHPSEHDRVLILRLRRRQAAREHSRDLVETLDLKLTLRVRFFDMNHLAHSGAGAVIQ
jgi:hypothetical protein